ncbi:MAG: SPFH domain-containing protein [Deltaproteobacteria bacterium]|jgi:flotillin|nr:SPFH domain-containing protein [Deltaproteobacteria bacterium]
MNIAPFLYGIGAGVVVYIFLMMIIKIFFYIGKPNQVLIFSGRNHKYPDGTVRGYRYVIGGWAFRWPIIEEVSYMSLTEMPVGVEVDGAFSKGGISIDVTAIANVKVSSKINVLDAAIEHFLGQPQDQIKHVAKETLEGHLRGVLATLTPEQINEDRLSFAGKVEDEVIPDFEKLGLQLDNFKIQSISDSEGYLEAIGKLEIEQIKKKSNVAESDADRTSRNVEEESQGKAKARAQETEMIIKQATNELDAFINDELAKVTSEEERTKVAAQQARAEAEQVLQKVRAQLEEKRREVEEILPAQKEKEAAEIKAVGEAVYMQKKGEATAKVLEIINEVWKDAGNIARDVYVLQQIEEILDEVVESVKTLNLGKVVLLDGGDGETLKHHIQSYPAMISAVMEELKKITGIDIPGVLSADNKKSVLSSRRY